MSRRQSVLLPAGTGSWPDEAQDPLALVVSVVRDGHVVPVFTAHPEHECGRDPFRGYVVEAADPLSGRPDVGELVRAMHHGGGLSRGITVTTLRLKGGVLQGLGITVPPAEAAVLRAGQLATGVDLTRARAALFAGVAPRLTPSRRSSAGVRVFYPPSGLTVDELQIEPSALPGGIWEVELLTRPGEFAGPPGRAKEGSPLALGVAVGEHGAACRRALDLLPRALRVRGRRL
uniref:hypothetical protein n=1 Tax=Streptomyces sp. NBC_00998 TaxID=2903712 RepID=UPI002F90F372|nr:hypothetical protein OG513_39380 [Streptomyces sp. NBC_00998]